MKTFQHPDYTPGTIVKAIDMSNWDGPLAEVDTDALVDNGWGVAVVRMSIESATLKSLAIQQLEALKRANIWAMGYGWGQWDQDATTNATAICSMALAEGVRVLWWDAEQAVEPGQNPAQWLQIASSITRKCGIVPGIYSAPWWTEQYHIDLSPLGPMFYWGADWDNDPVINIPPLWPTAAVVGKQYTNGTPGLTKVFDADVFTMNQTLISELRKAIAVTQPTPVVTTALVGQALDEIVAGIHQGTSFVALLTDILARLDAAGTALSLSQPPPKLP